MTTSTTYWRSLEHLQDPSAVEASADGEFAAGAAEAPVLDDVSRRKFLGLAAATAAVAGTTSCRKPVTHILPFARRPEDLVPGNPLYYASAYVKDGIGTGILVKSSDGRPTKIEGNPLHPSSLGGTDHLMQAELLNLYDPARSLHPLDRSHAKPGEKPGEEAEHESHTDHRRDRSHASGAGAYHATLADFAKFWAEQNPGDGSGLRLLIEPTGSPTITAELDRLVKKYPKAVVHTWSPVNRSAAIAATQQAFGRALDTHYDLWDAKNKRPSAKIVASFDCDFLSQDGSVRNARDYAKGRKITAKEGTANLSRLYAIESYHSVTGSNADHQFRLRPSEIGDAAMSLAAELGNYGVRVNGDYSGYANASANYQLNGKSWVKVLAKDLAENKGRCAVLVGPRLPVHVQVVLHAINKALGATVSYTETPNWLAQDCGKSITQLTTAMNAGSVDTLVVLGGNPVYSAPADLDFGAKLAKVKTLVHLSLFVDETSSHEQCTWHVNQAHDLEAWCDARGHDGTVALMQPLIAPLYDGISTLEMIALLTDGMQKVGDEEPALPSGYDIVRGNWKARASGNFETWWARALHDGVVLGTEASAVGATLNAAAVTAAIQNHKPAAAGSLASLEVQFRPDFSIHDGRYSNNSWLMELPDPMSKITWDNAALLSLKTLEEAGLEQGDLVDLTLAGKTVRAPVWVLPGHADYAITLTLGYGRSLPDYFHAAQGAGFDAYAIRTVAAHDGATGLKMSGKVGTYEIAVTQEHGTMEGRALVREADVAKFEKDEAFAKEANPMRQMLVAHAYATHGGEDHDHDKDGKPDHGPEDHIHENAEKPNSLWKPKDLPDKWDYSKGNQWGMVIDLNSCIGCNACVSACVSENNIPMVGKEQVSKGREMFWNRIDRYFGSNEDIQFKHEGPTPKFNVIPAAENPKVVHQMVPCMQCENASCEVVCPVSATQHSPEGLNDMAYNRCIGTRYCGNNCPYKVRRFNYLDYRGDVPETTKMAQNPDVTVHSRGVMEKCTYCVQRINRVKIEAKKDGRRAIRDGEIATACEQSCPTEAITFGNINDPESRVTKLKDSTLNYGMLAELNMRPRTTYLAKIRNPNPELVNKS